MNIYVKKILFCFIAFFLILIPVFEIQAANPALQEAQKGLLQTASPDGAGLTDKTVEELDQVNSREEVRKIITQVMGYILAMLGVILLVQIIFAGYSWMMSGGNEEKIKKAKDKIVSSIIGLAIIMIAYVLVSAIFGLLVQVTQEAPPAS